LATLLTIVMNTNIKMPKIDCQFIGRGPNL
jgi:hypothetical protein